MPCCAARADHNGRARDAHAGYHDDVWEQDHQSL
jgi:hypothetical protein